MADLASLERSADVLVQHRARQVSRSEHLQQKQLGAERRLRETVFRANDLVNDIRKKSRQEIDLKEDLVSAEQACERENLRLLAAVEMLKESDKGVEDLSAKTSMLRERCLNIPSEVVPILRQMRENTLALKSQQQAIESIHATAKLCVQRQEANQIRTYHGQLLHSLTSFEQQLKEAFECRAQIEAKKAALEPIRANLTDIQKAQQASLEQAKANRQGLQQHIHQRLQVLHALEAEEGESLAAIHSLTPQLHHLKSTLATKELQVQNLEEETQSMLKVVTEEEDALQQRKSGSDEQMSALNARKIELETAVENLTLTSDQQSEIHLSLSAASFLAGKASALWNQQCNMDAQMLLFRKRVQTAEEELRTTLQEEKDAAAKHSWRRQQKAELLAALKVQTGREALARTLIFEESIVGLDALYQEATFSRHRIELSDGALATFQHLYQSHQVAIVAEFQRTRLLILSSLDTALVRCTTEERTTRSQIEAEYGEMLTQLFRSKPQMPLPMASQRPMKESTQLSSNAAPYRNSVEALLMPRHIPTAARQESLPDQFSQRAGFKRNREEGETDPRTVEEKSSAGARGAFPVNPAPAKPDPGLGMGTVAPTRRNNAKLQIPVPGSSSQTLSPSPNRSLQSNSPARALDFSRSPIDSSKSQTPNPPVLSPTALVLESGLAATNQNKPKNLSAAPAAPAPRPTQDDAPPPPPSVASTQLPSQPSRRVRKHRSGDGGSQDDPSGCLSVSQLQSAARAERLKEPVKPVKAKAAASKPATSRVATAAPAEKATALEVRPLSPTKNLLATLTSHANEVGGSASITRAWLEAQSQEPLPRPEAEVKPSILATATALPLPLPVETAKVDVPSASAVKPTRQTVTATSPAAKPEKSTTLSAKRPTPLQFPTEPPSQTGHTAHSGGIFSQSLRLGVPQSQPGAPLQVPASVTQASNPAATAATPPKPRRSAASRPSATPNKSSDPFSIDGLF